ncbi:LPXTG cell wall anchor domain-containing protein [Motilibacter rhizosphaerae]|nr:LPXTG cell wall anchor domain-containing protein [Motilibacter rhizosphaerae]
MTTPARPVPGELAHTGAGPLGALAVVGAVLLALGTALASVRRRLS